MRYDRAHHPPGLLTILRATYRRLASLEERRKIFFLRIAVLASSVLLMLPSAWGHSVTVVEFAHLPAGLAAWQRHSLGIYRVCGPVSKWFYSLGPYLAGTRVLYPPSFDTDVGPRHEWEIGKRFQIQHRETCQKIYRWSRLLPILVTILGGCLVCEWSTRLFGVWQGIVSLCVWCWMAPVLAHGALVTSDMPSAVLMLLAARTFWGFLIRPTASTMLASGAALGFAQATKYTLLILDPCWAVLLICRAIQLCRLRVSKDSETGPNARSIVDQPQPSTARLLAFGLGILLVSVIAIDASYGFRGLNFSLSERDFKHSSLAREVQEIAKSSTTAWLLHVPLLIPIEFLRGLDVQLADTERLQSAYLLGQNRHGGWWYWYTLAALIKIPLPVLIIYTIAIIRLPAAMRCSNDLFWSISCLLIPACEIFLAISATTGTGTNAAFRYLLPSLALLCVYVGVAWDGLLRIGRWSAAALLGWLLACAMVAVPDHLGWWNELGWAADRCIGRPPLIGDSLDWGQDLLRLGSWIAEHSEQGSTAACVYSIGIGEPFGLESPAAQSTLKGATFLAVSENILFGDHPTKCVPIHDGRLLLNVEQRELLQITPPLEKVGRTIRIYRLKELPAKHFSNAAEP
jgi:hypothetical protein